MGDEEPNNIKIMRGEHKWIAKFPIQKIVPLLTMNKKNLASYVSITISVHSNMIEKAEGQKIHTLHLTRMLDNL